MKIKRPLLIPFSILYGFTVWLRNILFDLNILKSKSFKVPVIVLGNLNVGGTGKTPHTQFVVNVLQHKNIAVLSRGYGRKSKGFFIAENKPDSSLIGDEPAEIKTRFPKTTVAVDEDRVHGIETLLAQYPDLDAVILDDAYQHRYVKPKLAILLTTYQDLYCDDVLLPGGNLRESKTGRNRAQIVLVTKCPVQITDYQKIKIQRKLKLKKHQHLFFTRFNYGAFISTKTAHAELKNPFVLLTGIATPEPLLQFLQGKIFTHIKFKDHHNFVEQDYTAIADACNSLKTTQVLTTAKDFMRLDLSHPAIQKLDILQVPINVEFLEDEAQFQKLILATV